MNATTHNALTESHPFSRSAIARGGLLSGLTAGRPGLLGRISDTIRLWRLRSRERQAFAQLDQRDLRDIGLSRWEVEQEMVKPFWRD